MISFIKKKLNNRLSMHQKMKLRIFATNILSVFAFGNLTTLGKLCGTDKIGLHNYIRHYSAHFKKYKRKKIKLLEIGVGGYDDPVFGGHSLRMWKKYFTKGKIFSIDIYDKSALQERRIKIFKGSQVDEEFLNKVIKHTGELDIIIDDGSHMNEHIITTFKLLFPKLKDGGLYVIEDLQTSYFPDYGGDSENMNNPNTAMNFFKSLTDSLNHCEFLLPNYEKTYFDKKIISIHFYHNLIFIYKGNNDEPSNCVLNGRKK